MIRSKTIHRDILVAEALFKVAIEHHTFKGGSIERVNEQKKAAFELLQKLMETFQP